MNIWGYVFLVLTFLDFGLSIFLIYIATSEIKLSVISGSLFILLLFSFRTFDVENLDSFFKQLTRFLISSSLLLIFVSMLYSVFTSRISYNRYITSVVLQALVMPLSNFVYSKFTERYTKPKKYLVIGRKDELREILDEIIEKSKGKYTFEEFINPSCATIKQKMEEYDNILIGDYELYKRVEKLIKTFPAKKVEYLPTIAEKTLKRIPLLLIDKFKEYYLPEFEKSTEPPSKRVIDVLGSVVGIIMFSPLILISSLLILLEDGKPIVHKQLRVGKNGKYFLFIKLRSLKNEGFNPCNPNENIEDRLLKVGKFIRLTRIDEALQFWLVLKGDMSLVGPRPEMIEYHRMCQSNIPYYNYRLKLKPGITGWAQINFSHTTTLEEYKRKTEFDLYYIKNRSTLLDLRILLQTIETIFWRRGSR